MTTTTYRFQEVRYPFTIHGHCPACGKRAQRSRTFIQTLNPYNRNEDGTPEIQREIRAELRTEAEAWNPDLTHDKCRDDS